MSSNEPKSRQDDASNEEMEDFRCSICLEYMIEPMSAPCGHTYCECCIAKWLHKKKSCPTCREPVRNAPVKSAVLDRCLERTMRKGLGRGEYDAWKRKRDDFLKIRSVAIEKDKARRRVRRELVSKLLHLMPEVMLSAMAND